MTLKGKKKFLRNMIVCLVAVVFVTGIASVVYSNINASIKINFKGNEWEIGKENEFNPEWFMDAKENEVKFIVDLSDYKKKVENGNETPEQPPVETPEEPAKPEETPNPGETEKPGETENTEGNDGEATEEISEVQEPEVTPDEIPEQKPEGGDNTTPDNPGTDVPEVEDKYEYPKLEDVMDIVISTDNQNIEFIDRKIEIYFDEEIGEEIQGKYVVTATLNNKEVEEPVDTDEDMVVDVDYNINVELTVKENQFEIPVTSEENPAIKFNVVKDIITPTITTNLTNNEIVKVNRVIDITFSEDVNLNFEVYRCEEKEEKVYSEYNKFGNKFVYEINENLYEDGEYKLVIDTTDRAGNSNSDEITFTVNDDVPTVTIDGSEIKEFYNEGDELIVQLEANDKNGINLNESQFKLVKPGQNLEEVQFEKFEGESNAVNIATKKIDLEDEGIYLLTVIAKDNKGMGGVIFENKKIIVDRSPVQITTNVSDKDFYNNNKIVEINIKDDNLGTDIIKVFFNDNELKSDWNTSPIEGVLVYYNEFTEPGNYTIEVNSTDAANNKPEKIEVSFTIDKKAPSIEITDVNNDKFDGNVHLNVDEVILNILTNDDNQDKNDITIEGIFNGESILKNEAGESVENIIYNNNDLTAEGNDRFKQIKLTEEGKYTITVDSTDKAGNTKSKTIEFVIDRTAPEVNISIEKREKSNDQENENRFYKTGVNVVVDVVEENYSNYETEIYFNKDNAEENVKLDFIKESDKERSSQERYLATDHFNKDGIYTFTAIVTDKAGHIQSKDVTFVIDSQSPEIKITNNGKDGVSEYLKEDDNKNIEITIEDTNLTEKNNLEVKKDNKPYIVDGKELKFEVNENGIAVMNHTFNKDGNYIISIHPTDAAGNESYEEVSFIVDNQVPTVSVNMDEINLQNKKEHFFGKSSNKNLSIKIEDTNLAKEDVIKIYKNDSKEPLDIKFTSSESENYRNFTTAYFSENKEKSDIDGIYKVVVVSKDKAGNIYNKAEQVIAEFIIDNSEAKVVFEGVTNNQYFGIIEGNEDLQKKNEIKVLVEDANISDINSIEVKNGTEDYTIEDLKWTVNTDNGIAELPIGLIEDGHYKITVNSIDKAGNEVIENNTIEFTIDNEKPGINILANVLNSNGELGDVINNEQHINIERAQINLTISDINLHSDLSLSDDKANNFVSIKRTLGNETKDVKEDDKVELRTYMDKSTGTITISADVELEGTYTITVNSKDKANNTNSHSYEFTIDRTNPVVIISNYNDINEKFLGSNQNVEIKVTELNYNDGDIKINLSKQNTNGEFDKNYEREDKANVNSVNKYTTTEDGKYIYKVTGTDKAGNAVILRLDNEEKADINLTFAVDTRNPEFKIDGLDRENNHYNINKDLTITVTDDNQAKNEVKIFKAFKEGENFTEVDKTEFIVSEESIVQPTLDAYGKMKKDTEYKYNFKANQNNDGYYKIEVISTDIIGEAHRATAKWTFTIDSKVPLISFNDFDSLNGSFRQSFDKVIVNIDETNISHDDTNMTISYTKTTPNGVTSEAIEYRQRTNTETYTVDHNGNSLFADADAIYTFTVSGIDAATNSAITKTIAFTKDATKPEVSITGVEEGEHYNTDKLVKILSNDVNHEINTVTITKDGQVYSVGEFSINGRDAVINHTFSQEGEYEVTLYSKDKAGNDNTTSKKFTIDKTAPVITPVFKGENRVIKSGEYINKIFTPEFKLDKAEDKFDFITLNEGNVTAAVPMSSTEMVYHYTGQASDKAGNTTPLDITFTLDVTNPEVKVTGIIDGFFSEDMKPEYEITDTNLDNENTTATLNGKEFASGTKIKEQDYYNFKLLGTDLASNATARNIVFAIDKDKPVIKFLEAMSGKYFTEDFIPNFIIEDLTDYTIIAMTLDGVDYEMGDPVTEEGKHVLYIEVKDKAENVESISVEFILDKTPPKFIVNGIKNNEMYVEPVTAEITLENPLDKITGVTVNGELAQGDVKEENGQQVIKLNFTDINDYEVVLKAVDEAGNETEEVISFKIAKNNIFTTLYANKKIFYPVVIATIIIVAAAVITTVVRMNRKEEQEEESEE